MRKDLFFVCPTDSLESSINAVFKQENYYISSLGNSISFDKKMMGEIEDLIEIKGIRTVNFVLSLENQIVLDAVGNQVYIAIQGMDDFYKRVIKNKKQLEASWQMWNPKLLILSHHLNEKIQEFKYQLNNPLLDQLQINGKIYAGQVYAFIDIYSDAICFQCFSQN